MSSDWEGGVGGGNGDFAEFESDEELEEQWLEEWDRADRDAVDVLREALSEERGVPAPAAITASAVRVGLAKATFPFDWVRQAAALDPESLPEDDRELLVRCASATISPQDETGLDVEEEATLLSLEHADWLGAIVTLVRAGPNADASPASLLEGIRTCPEVNLESNLDPNEEIHIEAAFSIVSLPWHVLGLTDRDERVTPTGRWVLPRALARAWSGNFDDEPDSPAT